MLSSNQPYQRVSQENNGGGFIGGAVLGGGAAGLTHLSTSNKGRKFTGGVARGIQDRTAGAMVAMNFHSEGKGKPISDKTFNRQEKIMTGIDKGITKSGALAGKTNKFAFGGKKRMAAAYAGSVLAGGLLGSIGD
jgi:hypothetical protein